MAQDDLRTISAQIPGNPNYFKRHVSRYRKILKCLPDRASLRVLDVGVGHGFLAAALKKAGHKVSGLDFFYQDEAKRVCRQFRIPLLLLNVESHELPFKKKTFDAVVLAEVIEHLNSDPLIPLVKIRELLKDDGILVLTTPNALSAVNRIKRLLGHGKQLNYSKALVVRENVYLYGHHRLFTMDELDALLTKAGYKVCRKNFIFPGRVSPGGLMGFLSAAIVRMAGFILPSLRNIILITASVTSQ